MRSLSVFDKCGSGDLKLGCLILAYLNLAAILFIIGFNVFNLLTAIVVITSNISALILVVIIGTMLFLLLIDLAFSIVLLVGLYKKKPGHLKAFLNYNLFFLMLLFINLIVTSATNIISMGMIIQNVLFMVFLTYLLLVIRSMYMYMKDAAVNNAPYNGVVAQNTHKPGPYAVYMM